MTSNSGPNVLPFGVPPQRTPVEYDAGTAWLRIGEHARQVDDPTQPNQFYAAYLSLLYAVRGSRPGTQLPLRAADLEALLLLVGDDPDTIEQRLIGLMGCTTQEASAVGALLLRHRRGMATLGITAGLVVGLASGLATDVRPSDVGGRGGLPYERGVAQAVAADRAPAPAARPGAGTVTSVLLTGLDIPVTTDRGEAAGVPVAGPGMAPPAGSVETGGGDVADAPPAPARDAQAGEAVPSSEDPSSAPDAQVGDAVSLFEDPPAQADTGAPDAGLGNSADRVSPEQADAGGAGGAAGGGAPAAELVPGSSGTSTSEPAAPGGAAGGNGAGDAPTGGSAGTSTGGAADGGSQNGDSTSDGEAADVAAGDGATGSASGGAGASGAGASGAGASGAGAGGSVGVDPTCGTNLASGASRGRANPCNNSPAERRKGNDKLVRVGSGWPIG